MHMHMKHNVVLMGTSMSGVQAYSHFKVTVLDNEILINFLAKIAKLKTNYQGIRIQRLEITITIKENSKHPPPIILNSELQIHGQR